MEATAPVSNGTASEKCALYPLSALDFLFERTTFVTGWLVKGTLDSVALAEALKRVTEKWRMLAGRLHSRKTDTKTDWYIRIPLSSLPPDYPTFSLTTTVSEHPLTHYVPIPFEQVTPSFPPEIFIHPSTPRRFSHWEDDNHPLTCWHVTYFPSNAASNGESYTCIGFARSHGLFDGGGAALVMRALISELKGQEWNVPPSPPEGIVVNPVKEYLEHEVKTQLASKANPTDYSGMTVLGIGGALKLLAWHMREKLWRGATRKIILLPKKLVETLVQRIREDLSREGNIVEDITTGDVLVAWLLKTIYSKGTSPNTTVNCGNLASFRHLLPSNDSNSFSNYPHNAFVPLAYPLLSVADIIAIPLHDLTRKLSTSRRQYNIHHVEQAYNLAQQSVTTFLVSPHAHENLLISNVSASRILESDWSVLGAEKTICGYRYQCTPNRLLLTNTVFIAGRLNDGSTVLDITLNASKTALVTEEVERLTAEL